MPQESAPSSACARRGLGRGVQQQLERAYAIGISASSAAQPSPHAYCPWPTTHPRRASSSGVDLGARAPIDPRSTVGSQRPCGRGAVCVGRERRAGALSGGLDRSPQLSGQPAAWQRDDWKRVRVAAGQEQRRGIPPVACMCMHVNQVPEHCCRSMFMKGRERGGRVSRCRLCCQSSGGETNGRAEPETRGGGKTGLAGEH